MARYTHASRKSHRPAFAAIGWLVAVPIIAGEALLAQDLRSVERLRHRCESGIEVFDLTLFGNGTVRLREGPPEDTEMRLIELSPEELNGYVARLSRRDPTDAFVRGEDDRGAGFEGDWVRQCSLVVSLPGREAATFRFSMFDVQSLELARLITISEQLSARARQPYPRGLPTGYLPQFDDILEDHEGDRWRVMRLSEDEMTVELDGIERPERLFVAVSGLAEMFVAVDTRKRW